jgi:uncharacterized membrane protein
MRVRLVIGVVLCLVGALWIGQGVGAIGGSSMTGHAVWAVFGAIAVVFGVSLLWRPRRPVQTDGDDDGQMLDDR